MMQPSCSLTLCLKQPNDRPLSNLPKFREDVKGVLEMKVFDDGSTTLLDTLVSKGEGQDEHVYEGETKNEVKAWVAAALQNLDRRERYIVEQRLMADHEEKLSLAEIGRTLGVSRERARQLEARAKNKLKARLLSEAKGATLDVLREDFWDQRTAA